MQMHVTTLNVLKLHEICPIPLAHTPSRQLIFKVLEKLSEPALILHECPFFDLWYKRIKIKLWLEKLENLVPVVGWPTSKKKTYYKEVL